MNESADETFDDEHFDGLLSWDFEWWIAPFMDVMGPVFPTFVALVLLTIVQIYSGTAMTIVIAILIGGAFMTLMPPAAQTVGMLLIAGGTAAGIYVAFGGGGGRL